MTVSVRRVPSRSTTTSVGWSTRGRIRAPTSVVLRIGWPLMETNSSPGRMPAWYAGVLGSEGAHVVRVAASLAGTTHSLTTATRAPSCGFATPYSVKTPVSSTTAMTRFMNGPPSMMTTFLGTDSL